MLWNSTDWKTFWHSVIKIYCALPSTLDPTPQKGRFFVFFFSLSVYYTIIFYVHFEGTWILNLHYYYVKFLHLQSLM